MRRFRILARAALNQARNVKYMCTGRPVNMPSFEGLTLDPDDLVLVQDWLGRMTDFDQPGPVREFEEAFKTWQDCSHAYAFMGGRVALSACIEALDLQPGDEVIIPGYTCIVVPNAFLFKEIKPVYCDIELDTYGPDAESVERCITPQTKAILLHHLYGLVCRDYEALLELAQKRNLYVIEDCAQATGAEFKGQKIGNRGHVAFFSLEKTKILTTVQGGLATTRDHRIGERLKSIRDRSPAPHPERTRHLLYNALLGYYQNKDPQRWWRRDWARWHFERYHVLSTTVEEIESKRPDHYGQRMPAPLAVLGLNQLKKVDAYNEKRRKNAQTWNNWCEKHGYTPPKVIDESKPVFLRYPVLVEPEKKADPTWARRDPGLIPGVWFYTNLHPNPAKLGGCPNADQAVRQCINLPCLLDHD